MGIEEGFVWCELSTGLNVARRTKVVGITVKLKISSGVVYPFVDGEDEP